MKFILFPFLASLFSFAATMSVGAKAPTFKLKNQKNEDFDLSARAGSWTVLYFYPKSETPGCTKQACAFRDNIKQIRDLKAEVFGISVNSVEDQTKFYDHHKLNFDLLADADGVVTDLYGVKMPLMKMAKRWTFILGPDLVIRHIDKDVDPVKDANRVAQKLKELQGNQ